MTDDRCQKTEIRGQMTDDRNLKSEGFSIAQPPACKAYAPEGGHSA
jgi:hypothetical protein